MDTTTFTTQRANTGNAATVQTGAKVSAHQALGANGPFGGVGMNFMDMIFARIAEGKDLKNETVVDASVTTSVNDFQTGKGDILSLISQMINQADNNGEAANDSLLMANGDDLSAPPAQLIPYPGISGKFKPIAQLPEDKQSLPGMDMLSRILSDFKATLTDGQSVKITAATDGKLNLKQALIAIQNQIQNTDVNNMSDADAAALAASLNSLVVGGDDSVPVDMPEIASLMNDTEETAPVAGVVAAVATAKPKAQGLVSHMPTEIEALPEERLSLRAQEQLEGIVEKATAAGKKVPSGIENALEKIKSKVGAALSTITGNPALTGSLETTTSLSSDIFPENMGMLGMGAQVKGTGLTTTATMTSLSGNAPQAVYPHPATQAVAASISKAAANGEDKNFTLKLDPPELGRVEVKMSIDKHNKVKAHLVIEKPETFMMLQRDAHVLERSLQGIGMETGDSGLSFELAQDGNMFQNEGDRGGERYSTGGKDREENNEASVIESSMTWHVDPDTGIQHYNILA